MRGITPRLAGCGWAASFSGFIIAVIFNIFLGMTLIYLYQSFSTAKPWLENNLNRPKACQTTYNSDIPSSEIYLSLNITHILGDQSCEIYNEA